MQFRIIIFIFLPSACAQGNFISPKPSIKSIKKLNIIPENALINSEIRKIIYVPNRILNVVI